MGCNIYLKGADGEDDYIARVLRLFEKDKDGTKMVRTTRSSKSWHAIPQPFLSSPSCSFALLLAIWSPSSSSHSQKGPCQYSGVCAHAYIFLQQLRGYAHGCPCPPPPPVTNPLEFLLQVTCQWYYRGHETICGMQKGSKKKYHKVALQPPPSCA